MKKEYKIVPDFELKELNGDYIQFYTDKDWVTISICVDEAGASWKIQIKDLIGALK